MIGLTRDHLRVALVWGAYLALHSAMISITVTTYLKRRLGDGYRFYRLFFNTFALVTLVPVVLYTRSVQGAPLLVWEGPLAVLRWAMVAAGVALLVAGSLHYDMQQFLGVRQIREGARHALVNASGSIDDSGILGLIRHPYYSATILLFWAGDLTTTSLVVNAVVTVYVVVGTCLEERKLLLELGQGYRDYQARVSMLVPWKWLRAKVLHA